MLRHPSMIEIAVRVLLVSIIVFSAVAPTTALAKSGKSSAQESMIETSSNSPAALLQQQPIYFDTPEVISPQQTSPEPEKVKSPVPAKDPVEFTLVADPAIIPATGIISFDVRIRNNSGQALTSLVFTDSLESGLEYSQDNVSPVAFDTSKKEISLLIESLGTGEEYSFSYSLTVTSSKQNEIKGKILLHAAELSSTASNLKLKTSAALGMDLPQATEQIEFAPIQPEGGWTALRRVVVHLEKESAGKNALVMLSPAKIAGKGPRLQFKLGVYETDSLVVDALGELDEQVIGLKKEYKEKFKTPAFLEINLDDYVDLKNIPAGQEPYVVTYDETNQIWVKVPIVEINHNDNSVTVEAAHFSVWGAGLGSSLPQNGANVLLFDQPYTSLFTGAARYSIPMWTPPGRVGLAPDVSLSYSSATVDGVLGDVQAPWVGVGWNIDAVEIVRKIATDENGYGYRNEFALTLNGALYQLIRDEFHQERYFTDQATFLYIERHNYPFGSASAVNVTGEWWEVVTTDGTRYRLGWNNDSEQLALMYGYSCTTNGLACMTPDGAYASLGYAGKAKDMVAMRWRVDKVSDAHGNYIEYRYHETPPASATTIPQFDRESYLESISYPGFDDPDGIAPHLDPAYRVVFNHAARSTVGDVPTEFNIWDNIDSQFLDSIEVTCLICTTVPAQAPIRTYKFGYSLAPAPNPNGTLTLTSLEITGGGYTENGKSVPLTKAPKIRFSYQDKDNRASGNGDVFKYPRLATIDNGSGGLLTFSYGHDGRGNNSWYNYRVENVTIDSGIGIAKKQGYTYLTPVYAGQSGNPGLGGLIGYATVTESLLDFANNDTPILKTRHTFGTAGLDIGRELQTEWMNVSDTVLRKTANIYITDNTGAPKNNNGDPFPGWNYRYLQESASYEQSGGSLTLITKNTYYRDPLSGNLLVQSTFLGNSLYRKTYYEYRTNPDPKYYILDKVSRVLLVDASNQIYSDTRFHYDGRIDQAPTRGDVTLVQKLTGRADQLTQTVDMTTDYDIYGNVTASRAYREYGTVNVLPSSAFWESSTNYDSIQNDPAQSYPRSVTNALGQSTSMAYLYTLGVPYQTTDPNSWTTSTTYDGLGRTRSVTPPGLSQPGTWYTYPLPDPATGRISAPHSVEMQILDTIAGRYRSMWGIYDGAGRMIQTQADAGSSVLVNSTLFNAQGLARQQSLPYSVSGVGGNHIANSGNQFTATEYDPLGRVIRVIAPGNLETLTSYDGLTTTVTDPKGNKVSRTADGLGRMTAVAEFSDASTVYATTIYSYDAVDRLIRVRDAQSNGTTIQYDWLGRKKGMDDPDMGIWAYIYDPLGNMSSQTDARNHQLSFSYDALNRLLTKNDDDPGTLPTSYEYGITPGAIGLRVGMSDASGSTAWSYSNYGRTVTESRIIGGQSHSITTASDWLGRPISTTYDDGEVVSYTYDELGRPDQLKSSQPATTLVDLAYNVLGQIFTQTLGNGTVITNTYDFNATNNTGTTRLTNRNSVRNGVTQLDLSYVYDPNGNITRLVDRQLNETQFYQYDFLSRLTSAVGAQGTATIEPASPETYGQKFAYDKVGNILQVNNWGTPPPLATPTPLNTPTAISTVTNTPVIPIATFTPTITPSPTPTNDLIFADGFESGNLSGWTSSATDAGDLSVSAAAALKGSQGMQALIDDANGLYVTSDHPNAESRYRARFYFDPNSLNMANGDTHNIFKGYAGTSTDVFRVELRFSGGAYQIRAGLINDAAAWTNTSWFTITDASHSIEVDWRGATAAGANNGGLTLWIDGAQKADLTGNDNDTLRVDRARLGPISSLDSGTSGTAYFDAFESRRTGYIGPLAQSPSNSLASANLVQPLQHMDSSRLLLSFNANPGGGHFARLALLPPAQSSSLTFTSTADTYINQSYPNSNYGSAVSLQADNSPVKHILLKFDVTGLNGQPVTSAKIWLYNVNNSDKGGDFYHVSNDAWQEGTVTWNNAPAAETTLLAALGPVSPSNWYSVDVTSLITGDGTYSFRISSTSNQVATYSSKEDANPPQLIVETAAGSTTTPTFTPSPPATSTSSPTITQTPGPTETPTQSPIPTNTSVGTIPPTLTPTSTPTPSATATPMPDMSLSLMAHWNFEGITGATVPDAADGDNPATLQNGAAITGYGASGSAVSFSAGGQSALIAHHADLVNNNGFTLSAWINPSSVVTDRTQHIVNKGISDTDFDYGFITTFSNTSPPANIDANGKLVFRVGDLTPSKVTGPILPVNTWTLVTGVYDVTRGELRLYINGTLSAVEKVTGSITMGTGNLNFSSPTNWYHGKLDEVRFYNRALTDQEVTQLFGLFGTPTPLPSNTPPPTSTATLTPTATPLSASAQQWGTGADGNISVSSGETYDISSLPSKITNRSCPDAVSYSVTGLTGTRAYLSSSPTANCLQAGDEVMLINLQGASNSIYNTGTYEFLRVASISANPSYVQFTTMKLHWYGESYRDDDNLGTAATQQKVMLIRVPNYNNVTVNGVLTSNPWNGLTGGLAAFRVSGTLGGSGLIHMNGNGYRGGTSTGTAFQGESYAGLSLDGRIRYPNLGGGGAGWESRGNGGGAGHATNGTTSMDVNGGYGGLAYGQGTLAKLLPGSGGGGAESWNGHDWNPEYNDGGDGGHGGGMIFIAADQIVFSGTISAAGADGDPGRLGSYEMQGGAGSGGSVRIEGRAIALNSVSVAGGSAYAAAGPGRIAVYYQSSISIASTHPAAYVALLGGSQSTATPVPPVDPFSQFGTGQDGDLSITAYTSFNIHTQSQNLNRTCTTGGDSVSYTVTSLTNLSATLGSYPASHCLVAGDEVLLINLHGSSTSAVNTGKYEFLRVGAVVGNVIYFLTPKVNFYGNNASDDTGLGADQTVSIYRVPNYRNVTVNGTLTGNPWNGATNGVVAFRVSGTLNGSGIISANGLGFRGGTFTYPGEGFQNNIQYFVSNSGGGGSGMPVWEAQCLVHPAGGGGHATNGSSAYVPYGYNNLYRSTNSTYTPGGGIYGEATLSKMMFGAGGGDAYQDRNNNACGEGKPGGGIVFVSGKTIYFTGSLSANGNDSINYPGAGGGGSIRIEGDNITLNAATVSGGAGGSYGGGAGGLGRIAVYYQSSFSGNFTPGYLQQTGQPPAPTPTPIPPTIPTPLPPSQGWSASRYSYSPDIPHAVTSVDRGNFTDTFSYDANGNMTCRTETGVTYLQTYNAENRIASIAKLASGSCTSPGDYSAKWDFTYDGNGVRTGQSYTRYTNGTPGAAVITRYYFGGSYETTGSTWKKYYSFAGQIIAMRDSTGLKYFLTDHLGSILAVTADNGTPISQQRYLPFGQVRTDLGWIAQTDFGYTGQRKLDDGMGGIMDYRARFYSPYLKQFSQPDTIVPELNNPQSLNRYAYALNNPVRYNDPSGHKACEDEDENGKCVTAAEKYNKEAKKNRDAKDPDDLKTSDKVKEQIKVWEGGFYDTPYLDGPNGLTGNCTIGYGTMLNDGPCPGSVKKQYNPKFGGAPLTEAQGSLWFQDDIMAAEQVIKDTVHVKLTQGQFDALVSYIYNSGGEPGHWYVDKKIPEKLNSGHYYEAAMVIESGPTGGNNVGYAPGLVPRRHQEATMFLYGLYP